MTRGEQDLVADALLARTRRRFLARLSPRPGRQSPFAGDGRNLAGHIRPGGIVAPAFFQITVQKMEDGAVEPRLGIARFGLERLVVKCPRHIALAFVAEKIGQIGQRQRIVGARDQGGLIVKLGALQVTPLPPGRSQGQLQFGAFGFAGRPPEPGARWRRRTGHWRAAGWTD